MTNWSFPPMECWNCGGVNDFDIMISAVVQRTDDTYVVQPLHYSGTEAAVCRHCDECSTVESFAKHFKDSHANPST